jgi:hypothetical protein
MKITLLGDSIRMQYGPRVRDRLADSFEVWQPDENCRFAQYTLRGLFDWANSMQGTEIVHWNNGLWDVCRLFGDGTFTPEEDYIKLILRIADILKSKFSTVIFATTTPVREANVYSKNEDIDRFNKRVTEALRERGVIINDLNGLLRSDVEKYICEDNIHLSEEGIALCTEQVVKITLEAAQNTLSATEKGGETPTDDNQKSSGAPVLL